MTTQYVDEGVGMQKPKCAIHIPVVFNKGGMEPKEKLTLVVASWNRFLQ